jgi:hypothetical protein
MSRTLLLLFAAAGSLAGADLEMLPALPVAAFGGTTRTLQVAFRNRTDHLTEAEIDRVIFQAASATAAPVTKTLVRKKLQLLGRQTVLEEVEVDLPEVRAETRFIVRFAHRNVVLGLQDIWVYPTNLLDQLNSLPSANSLSLSNVTASLKNFLIASGARMVDSNPDVPTGQTNLVMRFGIAPGGSVAFDSGGALIECIRLPIPDTFVWPAYAMVFTNNTWKILAQEGAISSLSSDPWAQLRLLRMAKLVTNAGQNYRGIPQSPYKP